MGAASSWEKEKLCCKELEPAQRAVFCSVCVGNPNSSAIMGLFVIDQLVGRLLRLEMEI